MKKAYDILRSCVLILCVLVALVFLAVEGWLLLSGDWKLFEYPGLACMQLVLRIALLLPGLLVCCFALVRKDRSFVAAGLGFLAASVIAVFSLSNGLGWALVLLSGLFLLTDRKVWRLMFHSA